MNKHPRPAMREQLPTFPPLKRYVFWALACLFLIQVVFAVGLDLYRESSEFSNDVRDYHRYVSDPQILWRDFRTTGIGGGFLSSPLLPYLVYGPWKIVSSVGFAEQRQLFLGLRLTMIFWFTVGLYFTWKTLGSVLEIKPERLGRWLAWLIVLMPLNFIAPAVMAQDDCVCFGWGGFAFYCWRRWGIGAFVCCIVAGVWMVKPFLLFIFPAIWMAYPAWRVKIVAIAGLTAGSLLGFFYWRDGSIEFFKFAMNGSLSPTLYSIAWLWPQPIDFSQWNEFGATTRAISTPCFIVTMLVWCLSSWRKPYPMQSAIVGTYAVFFLTLTAVMPEYELWFLPWLMLVMWLAVQARNWSLFAACWLHSTINYAYKFFYACDKTHFRKSYPSPFEEFYEEYFNYDLRWVFITLAIAATICRLAIVYYLWRDRFGGANQALPAIDAQNEAAASYSFLPRSSRNA